MSVNGVSLAYLDASEESSLIEGAQTGDREAYLRLVRQYRKPVYRAAYSMVRDAEKAEALTRDVFVRSWQRIHDFPRGQRFFPWLLRAARGLFPTPQVTPMPAQGGGRNAPRGEASGQDVPGGVTAMDAVVSEDGADGVVLPADGTGERRVREASGPAANTPRADDPEAAWAGAGVPSMGPEFVALAAFAELRPDEQMALSLRLLERITYEEIGAILDLSLGVVTLRLSQARGHLLPRGESLPAGSA